MTATSNVILATIGYEGRTLNDLLTALKQARVRRVVDVRYLPLSHKKGFSKSALAEALIRAGIEYASMRELGTPTEMRKEYKQTGDLARLASKYRKYLSGKAVQLGILHDYAAAGGCCLLCFERDANLCHRSVLTDVMASRYPRAFRVLNL